MVKVFAPVEVSCDPSQAVFEAACVAQTFQLRTFSNIWVCLSREISMMNIPVCEYFCGDKTKFKNDIKGGFEEERNLRQDKGGCDRQERSYLAKASL